MTTTAMVTSTPELALLSPGVPRSVLPRSSRQLLAQARAVLEYESALRVELAERQGDLLLGGYTVAFAHGSCGGSHGRHRGGHGDPTGSRAVRLAEDRRAAELAGWLHAVDVARQQMPREWRVVVWVRFHTGRRPTWDQLAQALAVSSATCRRWERQAVGLVAVQLAGDGGQGR